MYLPVPMFTPTTDRVLVRKIEADKSAGGVLMPPSQKMQFEQGVVVAVGPGKIYENGVQKPVACQPGDRVMYSGTSAADMRMDNGETLWLMTESAILGIVPVKAKLATDYDIMSVNPEELPEMPENVNRSLVV